MTLGSRGGRRPTPLCTPICTTCGQVGGRRRVDMWRVRGTAVGRLPDARTSPGMHACTGCGRKIGREEFLRHAPRVTHGPAWGERARPARKGFPPPRHPAPGVLCLLPGCCPTPGGCTTPRRTPRGPLRACVRRRGSRTGVGRRAAAPLHTPSGAPDRSPAPLMGGTGRQGPQRQLTRGSVSWRRPRSSAGCSPRGARAP